MNNETGGLPQGTSKDSRGVVYEGIIPDIFDKNGSLMRNLFGPASTITRLGPRPVDVKRMERKGMSRKARRARAKLDLILKS